MKLPKKKGSVTIGPSGINIPFELIAEKAKISVTAVKKFAKENPKTFAASIVAGPVGYFVGKRLDKKKKERG